MRHLPVLLTAAILGIGAALVSVEGPRSFAQASDPLGVVLLMDMSSSMPSNDPENRRVPAGKLFPNLLDANDLVGIIQFSDGATVPDEGELSADREANERAIQASGNGNIAQNQPTELLAGLRRSVDELQRSGTRNGVIVLLTDGAPCRRGTGTDPGEADAYAQEIRDAIPELVRAGFPIFTIAFAEDHGFSPLENPCQVPNLPLMRELAQATGGRAFDDPSGAPLRADAIIDAYIEIIASVKGLLRADLDQVPEEPAFTVYAGTKQIFLVVDAAEASEDDFTGVLESPSGRVTPRVGVLEGVWLLTVPNPEPGDWEFRFEGATIEGLLLQIPYALEIEAPDEGQEITQFPAVFEVRARGLGAELDPAARQAVDQVVKEAHVRPAGRPESAPFRISLDGQGGLYQASVRDLENGDYEATLHVVSRNQGLVFQTPAEPRRFSVDVDPTELFVLITEPEDARRYRPSETVEINVELRRSDGRVSSPSLVAELPEVTFDLRVGSLGPIPLELGPAGVNRSVSISVMDLWGDVEPLEERTVLLSVDSATVESAADASLRTGPPVEIVLLPPVTVWIGWGEPEDDERVNGRNPTGLVSVVVRSSGSTSELSSLLPQLVPTVGTSNGEHLLEWSPDDDRFVGEVPGGSLDKGAQTLTLIAPTDLGPDVKVVVVEPETISIDVWCPCPAFPFVGIGCWWLLALIIAILTAVALAVWHFTRPQFPAEYGLAVPGQPTPVRLRQRGGGRIAGYRWRGQVYRPLIAGSFPFKLEGRRGRGGVLVTRLTADTVTINREEIERGKPAAFSLGQTLDVLGQSFTIQRLARSRRRSRERRRGRHS